MLLSLILSSIAAQKRGLGVAPMLSRCLCLARMCIPTAMSQAWKTLQETEKC